MANWHASLPQVGFNTQVDEGGQSTIRSAMDTGYPKVRKRYTAVIRKYTTEMVLDGDERKIFETFYNTTLNQGADAFDWTDPLDGTTASMRFINPVKWLNIAGSSDTDKKVWHGVLNLEILP